MTVIVEEAGRIGSIRKRNAQFIRAYVQFFAGGGSVIPLPPNPNIVTLLRPSFEYLWQDEEEPLQPSLPQIPFQFVVFPATVNVPLCVGTDIGSSLTSLGNLSLVGTFAYVSLNDPTVPYNQVITQSIPAGTAVGQGTTVDMTVQQLTVVPGVVGEDYTTAATADMVAAHLLVARQDEVSLERPGTVLAQSIGVGSQILAGTTVTLTVGIAGPGFRVQAVTAGWYNGVFYNAGDIFELLSSADFSDSTQNYEADGGEYAAGWMLQVASQTALSQSDGNATFPPTDPNRRFVE